MQTVDIEHTKEGRTDVHDELERTQLEHGITDSRNQLLYRKLESAASPPPRTIIRFRRPVVAAIRPLILRTNISLPLDGTREISHSFANTKMCVTRRQLIRASELALADRSRHRFPRDSARLFALPPFLLLPLLPTLPPSLSLSYRLSFEPTILLPLVHERFQSDYVVSNIHTLSAQSTNRFI